MRLVAKHARVGYQTPGDRPGCRNCQHFEQVRHDSPVIAARQACTLHAIEVTSGGLCPSHKLRRQAGGVTAPVAALFVRKVNHYAALGCDCYDFDRDALTWPGGSPGVFHPPCRAWGQLSHMAKPRPGEAELSIWAIEKVRQFGGVLEHPYSSRLWAASGCSRFGIRDQHGGVLVPLLQSWWGHRAPKKTCVYIVGPVPEVPYVADAATTTTVERMGRPERERTPARFAEWLVNLARSCA